MSPHCTYKILATAILWHLNIATEDEYFETTKMTYCKIHMETTEIRPEGKYLIKRQRTEIDRVGAALASYLILYSMPYYTYLDNFNYTFLLKFSLLSKCFKRKCSNTAATHSRL